MGEGRTQNSKSWEEEIYWSHFQFIHFTIFLQSTTDFQQQLVTTFFILFSLKMKPFSIFSYFHYAHFLNSLSFYISFNCSEESFELLIIGYTSYLFFE